MGQTDSEDTREKYSQIPLLKFTAFFFLHPVSTTPIAVTSR